MPAFRLENRDVAVRRHSRWRHAPWIITPLAIVLAFVSPSFVIIGFYAVILSLFASQNTADQAVAWWGPSMLSRGTIEVDGDEVVFTGSDQLPNSLPRKDIATGWIESFRGEHHVVLSEKNGDKAAVRVISPEEGNALLDAIGLGPEQRVLHMQLAERPGATNRQLLAFASALFSGVMAVMAVSALNAGGAEIPALFFGATALFGLVAFARIIQRLRRQTLGIGLDGLSIKGGGVANEFIPYTDVIALESAPNGITVRRANGAATLLPCWGIAGETIHERITRAMHSGGAQSGAASLELLDRNGQSILQWRGRLARLFENAMGAGYRGVSIERDAVVAVLGDSEAAPERRIAAAIALAGLGEPAAQERVRIAIDACANDPLRIAMSKVLDGDLEEADVEAAAALAAPRARTL